MRLIVCGGRDFDDWEAVQTALDRVREKRGIAEIIHGGAKGADSLAGRYAQSRGIHETVVPANWAEYGRAAGPIRNQQMLDLNPDGVVAFAGGRGTADMCRRALQAGIPVWRPAKLF